MSMTFAEVMDKVRENGNENQEKFKDATYPGMSGGVEILLYTAHGATFIKVTAEQFLKIYEILGE